MRISGSYRIAGVAVLCYASNSHFDSFDSMFIYQTLALPFLGLTLLAARRLTSGRTDCGQRAGWLSLAVLTIMTTVVTHHITSYMLVAMLLVITFAASITGNWRTASWAAILALLSTVAATGWLLFAAPETWAYLQPFADGTLQSFRSLLGAGHASTPPICGRSPKRPDDGRRGCPGHIGRCCPLAGGKSGDDIVTSRGPWPWRSCRLAGTWLWLFGSR